MRPSEILTRKPIEPRWIVRDMIPRSTMIVIAGEAGAGKSTLCYTMAYAVSLGLPFLGHQTEPTRVLYFDEENSEADFLQYNQWIWAGLGCKTPEDVDKNLRLERLTLLKSWKFPMGVALREHKPGLIIVDTANSAFHIQDENSNAEASQVMRDLKRIREESGCSDATFIIIKHEKQRDDITHRRTVRGAKVWIAVCDQMLYHVIAPGARRRKDGTRLTRLEPEKLRAFALRHTIKIDPGFIGTEPKGLILKGFPLESDSETESD